MVLGDARDDRCAMSLFNVVHFMFIPVPYILLERPVTPFTQQLMQHRGGDQGKALLRTRLCRTGLTLSPLQAQPCSNHYTSKREVYVLCHHISLWVSVDDVFLPFSDKNPVSYTINVWKSVLGLQPPGQLPPRTTAT